MKYEAFISYRHGEIDEKVATQIQKEIEKYKLPGKIAKLTGKKRIGRVFRDADELRASSDLSAVIKEALDESEWLFVICSKRYQESVWCMSEVEYFLEIRDRDHIIVILVEGEPEESFPKVLTEVVREGKRISVEPLAVDIRAESEKEILKNIKKERFRFLASMLSVDFEDLRQRQRERSRKRAIGIVGAGFVALSVVLGVITYKNIQLNSAYQAVQKGESYYLSEYATEAYLNADQKTAILLALASLPTDLQSPNRPFVPSVMRSLTQALGVYDFSFGYRGKQLYEVGQDTTDVKTQLSADSKLLLVEKYYYAANNTLNRGVDVYEIESQKCKASYQMSSVNRNNTHDFARAAYLLADSRTLAYLTEDSLRVIDVYTGKEKFRGEAATELKVSEDGKWIIEMNYETGYLYGYSASGELVLNCEMGVDYSCTLGEISPSGDKIAAAVQAENAYGIIVIDRETGENSFYEMVGKCSNVQFIDDKRLCFLLSDDNAGLKHVVQYDIKNNDQGYLCDADWNLTTMTLSEEQTCYYYKNNKVYEVDCNSKKGEKIWEHTFAANVLSIRCGDGVVAISCKDGSVSFYDEKSKELINEQQGNGEAYYLLSVNNHYGILRDYWGKHIRIYEKYEQQNAGYPSLDISSVLDKGFDKWYTCDTDGSKVVLGLARGMNQKIVVFDTNAMQLCSDSDLFQMKLSSFDHLSIDVKNENYISVQDYDYNQITHWQPESLKSTLKFDESNFYYYDEEGKTVCLSKKGRVRVMDAITGEQIDEFELPASYDKGVSVGKYRVFSSATQILIEDTASKNASQTISDAELYAYHKGRGLIFYRDPAGQNWYVYSLDKKKVVLSGTAGMYSCTTFFGKDEGSRYFLNDYKSVYDLDTMKQVLDLSEISNGVYGVQTVKGLPYFVVWCQEGDAQNSEKTSGSNIGYLYAKNGTGEILAEIPNFVALARDGKAIVFDGKQTLFKIALRTTQEIKSLAEYQVGETTLTDWQKEKYHMYGKE